MLALTKDEMKILDKAASDKYGIPEIILMEHAAIASASLAESLLRSPGEQVLVICGPGNNGADGIATARILSHKGYIVQIFILPKKEALSELSLIHLKAAEEAGIPTVFLSDDVDFADKSWETFDRAMEVSGVFIDAIFGISLSREVNGKYKEAILRLNRGRNTVISLDIPSGVDSDTGEILGCAVRATHTISFAEPKLGLYLFPGANNAGKIHVADIMIPKKAYSALENPVRLISADLFEGFHERNMDSHKGSFGKLLVIAGSPGMAGAAILASKAAFRAGLGLVKVLGPEENRVILQTAVPEAIYIAYSQADSLAELTALVDNSSQDMDAVLIGPGLSMNEVARRLTSGALKVEKPLIIDADSLNLIASSDELRAKLMERKQSTVLTPHLGEMGRLAGGKIEEIKSSLIPVAKQFAHENNVALVLKSSRTLVAFPKGSCYLNILGNSGMATAGSGDVLAGTIAGLLAFNEATIPAKDTAMNQSASSPISPAAFERAVCYGVYIHSLAGDIAAEKKGEAALIASDIIEEMGQFKMG